MREEGGRRRYVRVRCEVEEDGSLVPLAVLWAPGVSYEVTQVARVETWRCMGTGRGQRYSVWIGGHQTHLYWDTRRWYVHEKGARGQAGAPHVDGPGDLPKAGPRRAAGAR